MSNLTDITACIPGATHSLPIEVGPGKIAKCGGKRLSQIKLRTVRDILNCK